MHRRTGRSGGAEEAGVPVAGHCWRYAAAARVAARHLEDAPIVEAQGGEVVPPTRSRCRCRRCCRRGRGRAPTSVRRRFSRRRVHRSRSANQGTLPRGASSRRALERPVRACRRAASVRRLVTRPRTPLRGGRSPVSLSGGGAGGRVWLPPRPPIHRRRRRGLFLGGRRVLLRGGGCPPPAAIRRAPAPSRRRGAAACACAAIRTARRSRGRSGRRRACRVSSVRPTRGPRHQVQVVVAEHDDGGSPSPLTVRNTSASAARG